MLAAALAMFGDVLAAGTTRLLSIPGEDTTRPFFYWMPFGFGELARGHLVLWNPHTYAGTPFFGAFGPALLYPPNWLHMLLPTAIAINVGITLHVWLAGVFVYAWTTHRGLHPMACLFAGLLFMFCGAHFWQIYRGHLHCLTTLVWAPVIFLAIDGVLDGRSWRWPLVGMLGVAMQILAGHVQYTFYTGIVAGLYALLGWARSKRRMRDAMALAAIYAGGASLAGVQLLTGLQTAAESRRTAIGYEMAAWLGFPPENVLTLVMPGFFGDQVTVPYWGRGTLSEMCLYLGVTGVVLLVVGTVHGGSRRTRWSLTMAAAALLLAFGDHTPLFRVLYDHVPGFASFRGTNKFIFLASLFLIMLAAVGLDRAIRDGAPRWLGWVSVVGGVALLAAGLAFTRDCGTGGREIWHRLLALPFASDGYRMFVADAMPEGAAACGSAAHSAQTAAWLFVLTGTLVLACRRYPRLVHALAIVGVLDVALYARSIRPTFDPRPLPARSAALRAELDARDAGDSRVLSSDPYSYVAMGAGAYDLWGAEPGVLDRYSRFVALTQQWPLDALLVTAGFRRLHPLLGMLRLRHVVEIRDEQVMLVPTRLTELPRALLVPRWQVSGDPEQVLRALPRLALTQEALLESDPGLGPVPDAADTSATGRVTVADVSTEEIEIHAETPVPAILIVTDNYSASWHAEPWDAASTATYRVMPADYLLRGIPLTPGTHHIRLVYRPSMLRWGAALTIASLALYGTAVMAMTARRRRASRR